MLAVERLQVKLDFHIIFICTSDFWVDDRNKPHRYKHDCLVTDFPAGTYFNFHTYETHSLGDNYCATKRNEVYLSTFLIIVAFNMNRL